MAFKKITGIQQLDFQINRVLTYGDLASNEEEVVEFTKNIRNLDEWYQQWITLGERAEHEKRYMHSAYAYRMAEFFMKETHQDKRMLYKKSVENFYKGFKELGFQYEIIEVPYQNTYIHSLYFKAGNEKETIVICGGYDSFIEEFVLALKEFIDNGYSIVLFEGDGQGETLQNGMPFIHNWERPTTCLLDYYDVKECIMIGISWGGYLALRAAAFDKRIQKVAAYDVLDNGYECMTNIYPLIICKIIRMLMKKENKKSVNCIVNFLRKKSVLADWAIMQGMYITQTETPFDFYQKLKKHILTEDICDEIRCDVLLLAGEKDHYIPKEQFYRLNKKIKHANTLRSRLFTSEEGGEQHCQIGNHRLAIEEIIKWINMEYVSSFVDCDYI